MRLGKRSELITVIACVIACGTSVSLAQSPRLTEQQLNEFVQCMVRFELEAGKCRPAMLYISVETLDVNAISKPPGKLTVRMRKGYASNRAPDKQ